MAKQDVDAGIGHVQLCAIAADQLNVDTLAAGFFAAQRQAQRVGVQPDQTLRGEGILQVLKRLALATACVKDHRCSRQLIAEQAAQVIDGYTQHMVLPSVAAQEPKPETGFFDVSIAQRFHAGSVAQMSDSMRKRRLGSLTNGLRSSQA